MCYWWCIGVLKGSIGVRGIFTISGDGVGGPIVVGDFGQALEELSY